MVGVGQTLRLLLSWFERLAGILRLVEEDGRWPEGLLDAKISMIPKMDGDGAQFGQRPLCGLYVVGLCSDGPS